MGKGNCKWAVRAVAFVAVFALLSCMTRFISFGNTYPLDRRTNHKELPRELRDAATRHAKANAAFIREAIARLNDGGREVRVRGRGVHLRGRAGLEEGLGGLSDGTSSCRAVPDVPIGKPTVITLVTADAERHFVVYVPQSYLEKHAPDASREGAVPKAPVVFLYHGLGDNCEGFLKNTGFVKRAELDGQILVSGCGTSGWLGTGWNAGMCCGFTGDAPDELAYSLQVLRSLEDEVDADGHERRGLGLCINANKVVAVGFSNGAMLAEVLSCRAPSVFRVAGSVGGVTEPRPGGAEGLRVCDAAIVANNPDGARPSVVMVHGDADIQVPWGGNSFLGFPSMPENVDAWVARNGCDPSAPTTTINDSNFVNTLYTGCEAGGGGSGTSSVEVVRVLGGAHRWPERDGFSTTGHMYAFAEAALGGWD